MENPGEFSKRGRESYLGVFAKFWRPGAVKTRLAASVGSTAASLVYRAMVEYLLARFAHVGDCRELCFTPVERRDAFARLAGPQWSLSPQEGASLGKRMCHFFQRALESGHQKVVLIGSDSPTLPAEYVERAFCQLESAPVVLGPSKDGGYYLVGASRRVPPIFEEIEWSTPSVWEQTVDKLRKQRLPYAQLPPWYDVDQLNDLLRLRDELRTLADEPAGRLTSTIELALPNRLRR